MSLPINITLDHPSLVANQTAIVTIYFNDQSVTNLETEDLISQDGTFSNLQIVDEGASWTALFTPNPGVDNPASVISLSSNKGGASSDPFHIDTELPTATIVVTDNALTMNETSQVTITFNEEVRNFVLADLSVPNGSLSGLSTSDEGKTWTAVLTPNSGTDSPTNAITLNTSMVNDVLGNLGKNVVVSSNNYSVGTAVPPPTATVSISDTAFTVGETATVTFAFSEDVKNFGNEDVILSSGTLTPVTRVGSTNNFTAIYTPGSGVETSGNVVTLNMAGVSGYSSSVAGVGTVNSQTYSIDTKAPTVSIVVADDVLTIGETSTVAITFSESIQNFEIGDLQVHGGSLTNLHQTNEGVSTQWSATFTPSADAQASVQTITLNGAGLSDLAGNRVVGNVPSNTFTVDTKAPTTASIVVDDNALKAGDTSLVTITFSESVKDLQVEDFEVQGGTLSDLQSFEGVSTVWTATFTPKEGIEATDRHITLNNTLFTDLAGNAGTGSTESNAYAIDTKAPTFSIAISDDNVLLDETATVTVTFSERVDTLDAERVTADHGKLSAFETADEGLTWTATFTPDADVAPNKGYSILYINTNGLTDAAGNDFKNLSSEPGSFQVNATGPTATITLENSKLTPNETSAVTITFSEAVRDFDASDVDVGSGVLSGLSSNDGGLTWLATLTPDAGVEDYSNVVSVNLTNVISDSTGVHGIGKASSNNYVVDTKAPTATIEVADESLTAGETAQVTITFSEYVSNFDPLSLKVENGTLGKLSTSDEGRTWHTTFTPAADVSDATNVVSLNMGGLSDWAGNHGEGIAKSNNYAVETKPPVVVTPTPTPTVTVDGVAIKTNTGTAADGSKTQVVTVPTVTTGRVDKDGTAALADIPLVKTAGGESLLSVGVPVGFGVKASGSTTAKAASDSLTNLIAEIKAHSTAGSAAQESMVGGGSGFLGTLANSPLLVQTIVVSAPSSTDVT